MPVKLNSKYQQIQWINSNVHIHDLQCECDKPLEHTIWNIFKQEKNLRFTTEEKQFLKQCLTTTEDTTKQEEDDVIGETDLEKLFSEDFGEENPTTDTADATR